MRLRVGSAIVLAIVLVALGVPGAEARDDVFYECSQVGADDRPVTVDETDSVPLSLLDVEGAHEVLRARGLSPGEGVGVAVLDSGVSTRNDWIPVAGGRSFTRSSEIVDPHGTEVAGLIAGRPRPDGKPIGIAPGARIFDVRVLDQDPPDTGELGVTTDRVAQGLTWVADNAHRLGIKVANVSLAMAPDPTLADAVRAARRAGVVVVAASGNRPGGDTDQLLWDRFGDGGSDTGPGEDAADAVFPAGYEDVVAVNATTDGLPGPGPAKDYVLASSATDVAAPTYDAVSVSLNGGPCRIQQVATSFAAAEVSGTVALLWSLHPDDTAAQVVARLEHTATGTPHDPTLLQGVGVIQPVEALTRPLHPDRSGVVARATPEQGDDLRATAPEPEADVLAATRRHAVWWGLLGGGALMLALLLRPVLARRRD